MFWQKTISGMIVFCAVLVSCFSDQNVNQSTINSPPSRVTLDIQEGIEKHIEEQTDLNEGYFKLLFEDKELLLRLVRVHTQYLANLGPKYHFACVDLVSTDGDIYDVDFFLAGDPGEMSVTETTIHKFNGQPIYVWKQKKDKTWFRFPVENAPLNLLGVITGKDEFEFLYHARLPDITGNARMWIPMPSTDMFQKVEVKSVNTPGKSQILKENKYGNRVLFLTLGPEDSGKTLEILYSAQRFEKGIYKEKAPEPGQYLESDRFLPVTENFRTIAEKVVGDKKSDLVRARALYDHTIERMSYIKFGDGWGQGDAVYACDARTGNCTDFHSYFIALSRAIGIPARFAIGVAIPSERNEGGINGYHCWAEFYADGSWWPVDVSEADKYSSLSTYYFGHHPANRLELSRGRDLAVEPGPVSGPINFLAYPVLETGGKISKVKVEFSFNR
ncbi:MAG: transglutaminase domain-containing protein [Deltaproteobacteria bacterium]|nr:transglutaminase domain-containing protein [Deltaproteobacteria bacterium]